MSLDHLEEPGQLVGVSDGGSSYCDAASEESREPDLAPEAGVPATLEERAIHLLSSRRTPAVVTAIVMGTALLVGGLTERGTRAKKEAFDQFCTGNRAQLRQTFSHGQQALREARAAAKDQHEREALDRLIAAREILDADDRHE